MSFKNNLRKQRNLAGISQECLAEKMSVSRQTVSKWENGDSYPSTRHIFELAEVFGCGVNELVGGDAGRAVIKSNKFNFLMVWAAFMVMAVFGFLFLNYSAANNVRVAGFNEMVGGSFMEVMEEFSANGWTEKKVLGYGESDGIFYVKCSLSGNYFKEDCAAIVYFCDGQYECFYLDNPEYVPEGKYFEIS